MFSHNMLCVGYTSTDVKLRQCEILIQFVQLLQVVIDKKGTTVVAGCAL